MVYKETGEELNIPVLGSSNKGRGNDSTITEVMYRILLYPSL